MTPTALCSATSRTRSASHFSRCGPRRASSSPHSSDRARAGEACRFEDAPFTLLRHGQPEEAFFDFSYSPVRDETGAVMGVLNLAVETTARVLAERRQAFRLALEDRLRDLANPDEIIAVASGARWASTSTRVRSPMPNWNPTASL